MNAQKRKAAERGWTEAAPGYWACGTWRVQRGRSGWMWWNAIGFGIPLPHAGKRGQARTMLAAMNTALAAAASSTVPTPSSAVPNQNGDTP